MTEGPFKSAFEADIQGVVRREIISYRKVQSGSRTMVVKEVAIRRYFPDGDYVDLTEEIPLP